MSHDLVYQVFFSGRRDKCSVRQEVDVDNILVVEMPSSMGTIDWDDHDVGEEGRKREKKEEKEGIDRRGRLRSFLWLPDHHLYLSIFAVRMIYFWDVRMRHWHERHVGSRMHEKGYRFVTFLAAWWWVSDTSREGIIMLLDLNLKRDNFHSFPSLLSLTSLCQLEI